MMSQTIKHRKQQDDRLLKQLSLQERRRQERLRRLIASDTIFTII
jgi:hypothetical protein